MLKNRPAHSSSISMTQQERDNLSRLVDYSHVQSLPEIWPVVAKQFETVVALKNPHAKPEVVLTYAQLYQQIRQFGAGLQALGITPQLDSDGIPSRVALVADNSPRWMIADQGIMTAGAANVVRSSQAEREELLFILEESGCIALVVEDLKTLAKLRNRLDSLPIQLVVLLSDEDPQEDALKVLNFSQLMAVGSNSPLQPITHNRETLATLMYTSGTGGKPKGVMLTHGNLLHQVRTCGAVFRRLRVLVFFLSCPPGTPTSARLSITSFPKVAPRFTQI
jgi:long-chain acyl-CoA synthetase